MPTQTRRTSTAMQHLVLARRLVSERSFASHWSRGSPCSGGALRSGIGHRRSVSCSPVVATHRRSGEMATSSTGPLWPAKMRGSPPTRRPTPVDVAVRCPAHQGARTSSLVVPGTMGAMALSFTNRERSHLKARAHALEPVVQIGYAGPTDKVAAEIDRALAAHELIEVRIGIADRASARTSARSSAPAPAPRKSCASARCSDCDAPDRTPATKT